jgi:arylsulfatase
MKIIEHKKYLIFAVIFILIAAAILFIAGVFQREPGDRLESLKDYNLVYINIDTLRADHLGCNGYSRNTSPFIDSLAKNGISFTRAMSNSSYTRESVSVLFTGRLPSSGGCYGWNASPAPRAVTLAEFFKKAGYVNGLFSNHPAIQAPPFARGFHVAEILKHESLSGNGPALSKRAAGFIKRNAGKKFMLYMHFLDPHGPYNPTPQMLARFTDSPFKNPIVLYNDVRKNIESLIREGFGPGEERFEDMVLRYDAEIALVDYSVKLLVDKLKEYGLIDNTLLIITSDHGEEFLEHGFVEHSWTLYKESLNVPLIFHAPRALKPRTIQSLVSTVDVLPTLLEMMQIPYNNKYFDGSAFFTRENDGFPFQPINKPFIAELLIQHRNLVRTIIDKDWKYIAAQRWVEPQYRKKFLKNAALKKEYHMDTWGPVIREELYYLPDDPGEKKPLNDPQKIYWFRNLLQRYMLKCRKNGLKPFTGKEKRSKKDTEKLKSLGYL